MAEADLPKTQDDILSKKISDLGLSNRAVNCLKKNRVKHVFQLVEKTNADLLRLPNLGRKSLYEIEDCLRSLGLSTGMILKRQLTIVEGPPVEMVQAISPEENIHLLRKVEDLNFSPRAFNCLKPNKGKAFSHELDTGDLGGGYISPMANINFIGDLVQYTDTALLQRPAFGRKTLREIKNALARFDLRLDMKLKDWTPGNIIALREKYKREIDKINQAEAQALFESALAEGPRTVESELQGMLKALAIKNKRQEEMFVVFYGWEGKGRKTLGEAGDICGHVTRERIRQVTTKIAKRFNNNPPKTPVIDAVMAYIADNTFNKKADIETQLVTKGFTASTFDLTAFLSLLELRRKKANWGIYRVRGVEYVLGSEEANYIGKTISLAKRIVSRFGYATLEELVERCASEGIKLTSEQASKILRLLGDVSWINSEENCFYIKTRRNRLITAIRKLLSVSSIIDANTLKGGLRRNHRILRVPNKQMLADFCTTTGQFAVSGENIGSITPLNPTEELGGTELAFYEMFKQHGCILSYQELKKLAMERGMNEHTFDVNLTISSLITNLKDGIYALRGAKIDPFLLESKRGSLPVGRYEDFVDSGWIGPHKLWLAIGIDATILRTGVMTIPKSVAKFLHDGFPLILVTGEECGFLKANEQGQAWGFKKTLSKKGADINDIMVFVFSLDKKTALCEIGDEELVEKAKAGLLTPIETDTDDDIGQEDDELEQVPVVQETNEHTAQT